MSCADGRDVGERLLGEDDPELVLRVVDDLHDLERREPERRELEVVGDELGPTPRAAASRGRRKAAVSFASALIAAPPSRLDHRGEGSRGSGRRRRRSCTDGRAEPQQRLAARHRGEHADVHVDARRRTARATRASPATRRACARRRSRCRRTRRRGRGRAARRRGSGRQRDRALAAATARPGRSARASCAARDRGRHRRRGEHERARVDAEVLDHVGVAGDHAAARRERLAERAHHQIGAGIEAEAPCRRRRDRRARASALRRSACARRRRG